MYGFSVGVAERIEVLADRQGLPDSQMLLGWIYRSKAASVLDGELCMASVGVYQYGNVDIYLLEPQFASQHRLRNRTLESKFSKSTWVYEAGSLCV